MNQTKNIKQLIRKFLNEEKILNDDFWGWFGNSKVIDKNGKPKIVYSGTDLKNTNNEYPIYFAKDKKVAENFGIAKPYYLKIETPFTLEFSNSWQDIDISTLYKKLGKEELFNLIKTEIGDDWETLDDYLNDTPVYHDPISIESVVNYVRKHTNHDGLIFYDIDETENFINTDTYVIFNKEQAKNVKTT